MVNEFNKSIRQQPYLNYGWAGTRTWDLVFFYVFHTVTILGRLGNEPRGYGRLEPKRIGHYSHMQQAKHSEVTYLAKYSK